MRQGLSSLILGVGKLIDIELSSCLASLAAVNGFGHLQVGFVGFLLRLKTTNLIIVSNHVFHRSRRNGNHDEDAKGNGRPLCHP